MKFSLPSKKIQALIIIVVALFLAYGLYVSNLKGWVTSFFSKEQAPQSTLAFDNHDPASDIDTDSDGLKDWQEVLWGTDKNNPDSDGDGVADGQEVSSGRDPQIKGPDDQLEKTRGISSSSVAIFANGLDYDPNNLSTNLSRDLFANFMALQLNGGISEEQQAALVSNTVSNIDPGSIPPKYTIADIKVVETNAKTLRAYGNALADGVGSGLQAVQNAGSDQASLAAYSNLIDSLKSIPVPSSLGLTHLKLINSYHVSHEALVIMIDYKNDPVKSLFGIKAFKSNAVTINDLLTNIAQTFRNNGIIFDKSESGYVWKNY